MARDIGAQMILAEWLFVETVGDLERRSRHRPAYSRYELLCIAPLLRKLLMDKIPLLDVVKADRLDGALLFRVHALRPSTHDKGQEVLPYLVRLSTPDVGDDLNSPAEGLAAFLATVIGEAGGKVLTVKQVIRYYAHVEGGVHFGSPDEPGEATLASMAPLLNGHSTGQIEILARLGRVTAQALRPLHDAILSRPTIIRGLHLPAEDGLLMNHWTAEYQGAHHS